MKNYKYENLKEMLITNGYWYNDKEMFIEIIYNNLLTIIVHQDLNIIAYTRGSEYFEDIENYSTKECFENIKNIINKF
jgi:hypothetical protein